MQYRRGVARAIGVAVLAAVVVSLGASTASAHEADAESDPPSGSTIDEPISEVTIEFGVDIADDVELALFGPGDDELIEPTTTTKTASNAAMIEFEPIEQRGTYIVRYLTVAPIDGHTIVGAVSFTYGSEGGGQLGAWLWFALAMIPILALGAALSIRLHRRQQAGAAGHVDDGDAPAGASDVDQDLPDVRV